MPRLWTGAALLLWGYSLQQPLLAAVAVLLEVAPSARLRWDFESRQYERCADASSVCFAAVAVYQFNVHGLYGIYAILALMPWCLVPLTIMQVYGTAATVPLSALVYSLRSAGDRGRIDLRLALGLSALVSASAGEIPREHYAAGVAVLLGWLLWARRPHRHRQARWLFAVALTVTLTVALQAGFLRLHMAIGDLAQQWFRDMQLSPANAERTSTAIGSLRQLKLSDQIYLRVRGDPAPALPLLLTEATYTDFRFGTWSNRDASFEVIDAAPGARAWRLTSAGASAATQGPRLTIALTRERELGIVPLPPGAATLAGAQVLEVQRHAQGALRLEAPPGLVTYAVTTALEAAPPSPPTDADLAVPPGYRALLQEVAAALPPGPRSARASVDAVRAHFAQAFSYALVQPTSGPWRAPLKDFLTRTRRGHCEYFASATVLLLRAEGVPARYAVGYAVDEYSDFERAWLARARDAHAWAQAYVDGRWEVVDTTPARWSTLEDARASPWQGWFDAMSWLAYVWRSLQAGEAPRLRLALMGLAVLLAALLLWRQRARLRRARPVDLTGPQTPPAGGPAIARLLERLARRGSLPAPGETTARFLRRHLPPAVAGYRLDTLIELYYAERFGAVGLSGEHRQQLHACVEAFMRAC